jgi:hypothetical protein|eukprot:COSAG01_NODE_1298_length_10837_cov_44.666108_8_plen_41_part_00
MIPATFFPNKNLIREGFSNSTKQKNKGGMTIDTWSNEDLI